MNSHRFKNINAVFDYHVTKPLDRKMVLQVLTHVSNFVRKDQDSISFFGGNLIGVYPIKWCVDDKMAWINDVLEVADYDKLCDDIYDLPDINRNFNVSSDAVNLSFVWLAYKALTSETLAKKDREALAHAAINMMQYKFISSLHTHRFKYAADEGIALAVYEALDNKSQLKRLGSWQALIDARTDDVLGIDSLHTKTIRSMENDEAVVKMVNDIWNRLKSIINILTTNFYHIRDNHARIASTNKFTMIEGEAIIKDSFNQYAHIKSYMHDLIPDKNAFIREELLSIVTLTINTVLPIYLTDSLKYISENYTAKHKHVNIPELIDDVLMYSFGVIRQEKIELHNLPAVAIKLRGVLRSSRITDKEYLSIKTRTSELIEDANARITETNVASTRIAVLLYIVLRALIQK